MEKRELYFYVPTPLTDFPAILTTIGQEKWITHHIDKFLYLIHELYVSRFLDKSLEKDSYVPLDSRVLRSLLGKRYVKPILNILIDELEIVECDGISKHHVGKKKGKGKCFGYRLTEKYRSEVHRQVMCYDTRFSHKVRANYYKSKDKLLTHLHNLLYRLELDIVACTNECIDKLYSAYNTIYIEKHSWDFSFPYFYPSEDGSTLLVEYPTPYFSNYYLYDPSSKSYIYSYVGTALNDAKTDFFLKGIDTKDKEKKPSEYNWDKFHSDMMSLQKIELQDYFFKERETRIFHNISSLRREIRKKLSIGGKRLKESDIKNSQPLLFALVLHQHYKEQNIVPCSIPDVKRYIELCEQGKIYDYLMEKLGLDPEEKDKRDAFKEDFFHYIFYCRVPFWWQIQKTPLLKLFVEEFPNVYSVLCEIKREDHSMLARRMQTLETDIIIKRVLKTMVGRYSDEVFVPVHDSILCREELLPEVQAEIVKEFKKEGISVALSGKSSEKELQEYVNWILNLSADMFAGTYTNFAEDKEVVREAFKIILAEDYNKLEGMRERQVKEFLINWKEERSLKVAS